MIHKISEVKGRIIKVADPKNLKEMHHVFGAMYDLQKEIMVRPEAQQTSGWGGEEASYVRQTFC